MRLAPNIVAELNAEAAWLEAVRGLISAFETKIPRTLARVWGTNDGVTRTGLNAVGDHT